MEPLISVLITSYNAGPYIKEAIESVFKQTYQNWELIILDDCSKDNTRQIIDSFNDPRIRKVYNNRNIGYVASKNILLESFNGDFACFLDADDWMHCERLELQLQVFSEYPDTGACMCNYIRVQPDGLESAMNFFPKSKFIDLNVDEIQFAGAGIMFSKAVVNTIGGFEMYFDRLLGDDNYWAFKIAEKFKFYYLNLPLYYYRANAQSITADFSNLRKLTIGEVLNKVKKQRLETGTDWLEQKKYDLAKQFEDSFLKDKKWLAEKYRIAAAVRLDYNDVNHAAQYLLKAFKLNPFSGKNINTTIYLVKRILSLNAF